MLAAALGQESIPLASVATLAAFARTAATQGRPEDTPIKYLPFAGLKGTADKAAAAVSAEQPTVDVLIAELATGFKFAATSMPATRPTAEVQPATRPTTEVQPTTTAEAGLAAAVTEAELAAAVTEAELAAVVTEAGLAAAVAEAELAAVVTEAGLAIAAGQQLVTGAAAIKLLQFVVRCRQGLSRPVVQGLCCSPVSFTRIIVVIRVAAALPTKQPS